MIHPKIGSWKISLRSACACIRFDNFLKVVKSCTPSLDLTTFQKLSNLLIAYTLFINYLTAQTLTLPYRRYDVEQGIASSDVFSMCQNTEGVLWFATDNGISRFDGLRFKNYFTENGLADNMTVAVETLNDTLFVICYRKGIQKFYNNQFDTTIYKTRQNYIQNHNNQLLFTFVRPLSKNVTTFRYQNGAYSNYGSPLIFAPPRATPSAFYQVMDSFIYKNEKPYRAIPKGINPQNIISIDEFENKNESGKSEILLGGIGEYYVLSQENTVKKRVIPELKDLELYKIVKDAYNRVWVKTNMGEAFVDINGVFYNLKTLLDTEKTVKIRQIFYDEKTKNMWVLTNTNGAYCVYNTFISNHNISQLTNNTISYLEFAPDGKLWIGTSGTLLVYEKEKFEKVTLPYKISTISYLQVIDNQIFIQATFNADVGKLFENTIPFLYKNTLIQTYVNSPFLSLSKNSILTGTGDTMIKKGNQYLKSINQSGLNQTVFKGFFADGVIRINSFLKRPNDTLWAGGYTGLNWQKGNKWGKVAPNSTILNSIINAIDTLRDGRIFVLAEKGIAIFENNTCVFEGETYKGRNVKKCRNAVLDNKGRLWLAMANGISVFDGEKSYFFDKTNGLTNSRVNAIAFDKKENCLWVGTNNGISRIDIALFEQHYFLNPKVYIERITGFDGKEYPLPKVSGQVRISKLPSNNLIVHLAAQDYQNPQSLRYEFQLDDTTWTETDSTLTLPSLSYGNHKLTVRAKIENSDWTTTDPLSMYVQYPFYLRWWFIGLAFLSAAGFVYWRIKSLKKQNEEKLAFQNQITELKQKGLAAMMNPHFIFNSLNSIQYFINSNNTLEANEYLAQFGKLIRYNLEASMHSNIILEEEMKRLELYLSLEKMRFNFDYSMTVDTHINKVETEIPSMIIQPFIENAIWHGILPSGKKGVIKVNFTQSVQNQIVISIEDNGVGIERSKQLKKSTHIARSLQIINERIDILNKTGKGGNAVIFEELKMGDDVVGTMVLVKLNK